MSGAIAVDGSVLHRPESEEVGELLSSIVLSAVDPVSLSAEELFLLGEIARGHSNQDIARLTGIAPHEVVWAIQSLLKTLNISGRAQAVLYAVIHRLVSANEAPSLHSGGEWRLPQA